MWVLGLVALLLIRTFAGVAGAACPDVPRPACKSATKGKLRVVAPADPSKRRLLWQWRRGDATTLADLGDPVSTTAYALCAYDAGGRVIDIEIPAGGRCGGHPCWTALGSQGFQYEDGTGLAADVRNARLIGGASGRSKIKVVGRGAMVPLATLPSIGSLTVQLTSTTGPVCFESIFGPNDVTAATSTTLLARATARPSAVASLSSAHCGLPLTAYSQGVPASDSLVHDGLTRTFRVYVPPSYPAGGTTPAPLVVLLHGGFGNGAQIEANARIKEVADAEGFVVVSPDGWPGTLGIRAWNAGACCGEAMSAAIDDVGFVAALLDHLEDRVCLDRRRVYATGISNGGLLAHRLACELSTRIRAIGPVAGTIALSPCTPTRPVPVINVHGTGDSFVPFGGGVGCGPSDFAFTSVPDTASGWQTRNGCTGPPEVAFVEGDGTCTRTSCERDADVVTCSIAGGGHVWPGGTPPVLPGIGSCLFGYQSPSFFATQVLWDFFAQHPPR